MSKTRYAADDAAAIKVRMDELAAERQANTAGVPPEETKTEYAWVGEAAIGWPFTAYDDLPAA